MAISLGVHVGQQNMAMDEMRALWRKLDAQGVDWISAWDHFYEAPPKGGTEPHFEALTTLGAVGLIAGIMITVFGSREESTPMMASGGILIAASPAAMVTGLIFLATYREKLKISPAKGVDISFGPGFLLGRF